MKDWLVRAGKTFVQAAVPIMIANATLIGNHLVAWDWSDWKSWLLPILLSAVAAGISAVWNLILEAWDKYSSIKEQASTVEALEAEIAELKAALKKKQTKAAAKTSV